ncbi:hypothetical protein [Prosthecobacter sp.]|uniref:hypothetical protein n=1 Tax=Prosthecobacter sp. TaxID=1965333 RepID=UPI0037833E8B
MAGHIERNTFYEFRLSLADASTAIPPGAMVVRVHSEHEIQVGEVMLDVSVPNIRIEEEWLRSEMERKQEVLRRKAVRAAIRRELKKIPSTSAIVLCVDSQTPLETIAIVWTSIQAVSKAALYFNVRDEEPGGVP